MQYTLMGGILLLAIGVVAYGMWIYAIESLSIFASWLTEDWYNVFLAIWYAAIGGFPVYGSFLVSHLIVGYMENRDCEDYDGMDFILSMIGIVGFYFLNQYCVDNGYWFFYWPI